MSREAMSIARRRDASDAQTPHATGGHSTDQTGPLWSSLALHIEPADSPQERQADAVASRVVQRKCDECEEEDAKHKVQRDADAGGDTGIADSAGNAVSGVLDSGSGRPLDTATREYFEPRFSQSFDDVRVHTGSAASASARSIHARAYTSGSDIVFRDGEFSPGTASGQRLLAHELTHVVQQRSTTGPATIARQADAGVADIPVAGPSPQPRPTPPLTTGLDAGFVDDPNAPPAGADSIVFAGIQLSSDATFVKHQLTKFIEAHERIDKGVDEARFALRRLANEIARQRGDLSSMHGVTPERERISDWVPRAERVLPVAQEALANIESGYADFLAQFAGHAEIMTASMLDMSLERVESEAGRYGVGVTGHTKTRRYKEADGPWTEQHVTTLSYHMAQNNATTGLAAAAASLADRLRTVKELVQQRNTLYEYHDFYAPNGMLVSGDITISDQKKFDELTRQIADARGKYEVLRFEKERDYPILAAYTPYDAGLGALPLEQTVRGLDALGKGPSGAVAHTLHKEIDGRRRDIQTTWKNLQDGKLSIWKLPPVVAATEAAMGVDAGSVRDRLVQEHVDTVASKDQAITIALSVLALALGLLAAIPSGGSSLVAAGTFVAAAGAASISVYFAAEHIDQYMLESAARGTDFDKKARAVSNADPSLFWLAVDVLSAIGDVFVAAKVFKELMKPVRAALNARRVGKAGAEIAQEKLDDIVKAAENERVKKLGEKVRDSILHQPGRTGSDADRALMQWESAINTESRASLVDNAPLRATYSEMSEGTRNVLTWCASNCLIPTATKTQVKKVDKLLAQLPKGGDDSSLRMYFHAYADDLDTALANLKDVKSWDDVDDVMRLEAFGGAGKSKPLSKKEIDDAIDEMFSPRVTGGQEARINGHKVAVKKRTRLDIQDIPRKAGETARKAYQRVKSVIYKRLDQIEAVNEAWNTARKRILGKHTLTKDNYGELYDLTRNQFWKEVRNNPAAKKHFTDAGFMFPDGETTAPLLANMSGSLRKTEIRISLDHLAEKAIGDNWKKALDAKNLQMEFAMPNTYREIIQARHPELRALTE